MKLFREDLPFLKGNFHCHTTESDGRRTPAEVMRMYRDAGYDVLAITDHRKVTQPPAQEIPQGLLLVPGIELDFMSETMAVHLLGLNPDARIADIWDQNGLAQKAVDDIRACGGEAVLAHPAWSLNTPSFMAGLRNVLGTEIYNSVSTLPFNGDRADSSCLIDITAASYGTTFGLFANDDSHFYGSEFAVSATMVQAREKTVPAVMDALREGLFYATQGPLLHQVEVRDGHVYVTCSPAEHVVFYSARVWADDRVFHAGGAGEAQYTISPDDRFVRVQVVDAQGRSAWSPMIRL